MAKAGLSAILIANEVVGAGKVAALVKTALLAEVTVAVDSVQNTLELASAASASDAVIGVVVDVDVGLGRCGVRSFHEHRRGGGAVGRPAPARSDGV